MAFRGTYAPGTILKFTVKVTSGSNVTVPVCLKFEVHEGAAIGTGNVIDSVSSVVKNIAPSQAVDFWWDTHKVVSLPSGQGDRDLGVTVYRQKEDGTFVQVGDPLVWNDTYFVEIEAVYKFTVGTPTVEEV